MLLIFRNDYVLLSNTNVNFVNIFFYYFSKVSEENFQLM